MPREWQRAWQVCRSADSELMHLYAQAIGDFCAACTFKRSGKPYRPTIACLKLALKQLGVISSDALGEGTPALNDDERHEFMIRFSKLRDNSAAMLERGWVSEPDTRAARTPALKMAHRNG